MTTIEITVYLSLDLFHDGKFLYKRQVSLLDSTQFDYTLVERAMRLLYGSKCVITFCVVP